MSVNMRAIADTPFLVARSIVRGAFDRPCLVGWLVG
jgi:hypothetical protein